MPTTFVINTPQAGGLSGGGALTSSLTLTFTPNNLSNKTSPVVGDTTVIYDSSAGGPAQVTNSNFLRFVPGLTNLTIPNLTSDLFAIYHAADGNIYKISPSALSLAAGNVPAGGTTNQFLAKASNANYDTVWQDPSILLTANTLAANPTGTSALATSVALGVNFTFTSNQLQLTAFTGDVFSSLNSQTATIATAAVTYAKFQQVTGLSVPGVAGTSTATLAAITGTTDQVLRVAANGTTLGFGQVNLSATSAVTGFLPTANITGTFNATAFLTGIVSVPLGGTGLSSLTANAVMLGNGTATVAFASVASATSGFVLSSSGTASPPTFSKVNLSSTIVTGTLVVSFGGTGTTTLTANGVLLGNGTSSVNIVAAGTGGQLFLAQGTGSSPQFITSVGDVSYSSSGTATIANNAVTFAKFQTATGLSVIGVSGTATANVSTITGTTNQVLVINSAGTGLVFGNVLLSSTSAVTGTLPIANGGTNATTAAQGIINLTGLALNTTGQAFTGGVTLTALSLGTAAASTVTFVAGNPPVQSIVINGTATFVAPSSDCEFDVMVRNAASAGSITFSGYSVGSNTGDTYATTSGNRYILMSRTITGSSTYQWKALQ